jgi:hypothetical protein
MVEEKRKPEKPSDKAKRIKNRELNDIRVVLSTPEGRRFYWRLLGYGQLFQNGYVPGDQGYGSTYNLGVKSVGLWALAEIMEAKPNAFTQMQREHASEQERERQEFEEYIEQKDPLQIDS